MKFLKRERSLVMCRITVAIFSLLLSAAPVFAEQESAKRDDRNPIKKSFSANIYQKLPQNEKGSVVSKIHFSPQGMREESCDEGKCKVVISRHHEDKLWILMPSQKVYVEIQDAAEQDGGEGDEEMLPGGILTTEPCVGFSESVRTRGGERVDEGLEEWQCRQNNDPVVINQTYDLNLGLVTRQEWSNGIVIELLDINVQVFPEELYRVPADFRRITLEEYITGKGRLPRY